MLESGDGGQIVDAALFIESRSDAPASLVRKAKFERAKAEQARGNRSVAVDIYHALRKNVANVEGAESAYRVIEMAYNGGNYSEAEELVYEFAAKNTPHQRWLAKSFLLLGDIYVIRGNLFQARATYQSVVDGYTNKSDGIVAEAKARVESLTSNPEITN
jgi:tetratricopeptide (TPR) repeat protein